MSVESTPAGLRGTDSDYLSTLRSDHGGRTAARIGQSAAESYLLKNSTTKAKPNALALVRALAATASVLFTNLGGFATALSNFVDRFNPFN